MDEFRNAFDGTVFVIAGYAGLFAIGFGFVRDGQYGVQLGCHLWVQFVLGNQASEDMVVGLSEKVGQSQLLEEPFEYWIEEFVAGLDVSRPGAWTAQSGERVSNFGD